MFSFVDDAVSYVAASSMGALWQNEAVIDYVLNLTCVAAQKVTLTSSLDSGSCFSQFTKRKQFYRY